MDWKEIMQLLDPNDYHTAPWRNGGGVTHEIVRRDGPDGLIWRLSMAEVTTDGPFSFFNNLTRVLTVIDGAGLELISPDGEIMALPYQPVRFSGDLTISSQRIDGAVRDLNLIFDPAKINGSVTLLTGPGQNNLWGKLPFSPAPLRDRAEVQGFFPPRVFHPDSVV